jgi:hypothetical protein
MDSGYSSVLLANGALPHLALIALFIVQCDVPDQQLRQRRPDIPSKLQLRPIDTGFSSRKVCDKWKGAVQSLFAVAFPRPQRVTIGADDLQP